MQVRIDYPATAGVYIVDMGGASLKLGMSSNLRRRLAEYEGYMVVVEVLLVHETQEYQSLERVLHAGLVNIWNCTRKGRTEIFTFPSIAEKQRYITAMQTIFALPEMQLSQSLLPGDLDLCSADE